jgi:hypothetical protein
MVIMLPTVVKHHKEDTGYGGGKGRENTEGVTKE